MAIDVGGVLGRMDSSQKQQQQLQSGMQKVASKKSMSKMAHDMAMADIKTIDAVSANLNRVLTTQAQQIAQA